ncbi:MAG: phosphatidylinositol-4-phosphate 5-kinase, partial [Flavobacteriaceae bacterium CG_4_8_14_3_um_filter_31_8]
MRNGQGKHTYLNEDIYAENFLNDLREGFGKYTYATGDIYEVEWKRKNHPKKRHYK